MSFLCLRRRAQGQAPLSLEAPVEQAPDSLCDSASPESTSGTCSSAWRMKEGPVTHTCSIKASSNSTRIKMTSGVQEAELTVSSDRLCRYFLWSPTAEWRDVCLGRKLSGTPKRRLLFKAFSSTGLLYFSEEQIFELGPDFSVPLSSVLLFRDQFYPTTLQSCTASCCTQGKCL